jgi:hypothetical protein
MKKFHADKRERIRKYVYRDYPLGPIDALKIDDEYVSNILFEKQGKIYKKITDRPSIVIGRRGAGKTAFLKNLLYSHRYGVAIEIKTYRAFSQIVRSVQRAIDKDGFVFTDEVAELWDLLFWSSILAKLRDVYPADASRSTLISTFLTKVGIQPMMSPEQVVSTVLKVISQKARDDEVGIAAEVFLKLVDDKLQSIEDIKEEAKTIITKNKTRAILLLDSLDDYKLDIEPVRTTLSGLLMCVGSFNIVRKRPEIRFCLPSELYRIFSELSDNRDKDFSQKLVLHWHAGELLSLAAHRYSVYLSIYDEGEKQKRLILETLDVHSKDDAITFFKTIFPETITNHLDIPEPSISYILRHTQLLPRQLLRCLTAIFKINKKDYRGTSTSVTEGAIKDGVSVTEGDMWKQVCDAYYYRYPDAKRVCEAIVPELSLTFSDGELHSVYVRFGKAVLAKRHLEYDEFKSMLLEIGCIGVVRDPSEINRPGTLYIRGIFEYTMPDTLNPSSKNLLCLHPMFCGGIKADSLRECGIKQVIYPHGADPDGEDYRDL